MSKLDELAKEITGEQNTFSFDGLYCNCYIRIESDNVTDIINALNKLYKLK